jgi:hypothetical protein
MNYAVFGGDWSWHHFVKQATLLSLRKVSCY